MVLKSVHMQLRTAEVPIRFLKDRDGRLSHHKRSGWFSPWHAAWINLQAMFVYGADFFLFKPGLFLLLLGSLLTFPLSLGPITLGPITFSLYWMLLGVSLALLGLQCVFMGILAKVFFDYSGDVKAKWFRRFSYTRAVASSGVLFTVGLGFAVSLTVDYYRNHFSLAATTNNLGITGLLLMIMGFMSFTFTLILHSTAVAVRRR